VSFHAWPTDRGWTRDSGAIFVRNREAGLPLPTGTSTPGQYSDWQLDDQVPGRVAELLGLPEWQPAIKLEDGHEHRISSKAAPSTSTARNSAHHRGVPAKRSAAAQSRRQPRTTGTGPSRFPGRRSDNWLNRGLAGDDTTHIDDITASCAGDDVTTVEPDNERPEHVPLAKT